MTTVAVLKKEVEKLRQKVKPKPIDRIVVTMWMPDDDPLHQKTDDEIIREALETDRRIILLPLRE